MPDDYVASNAGVGIRRIAERDLDRLAHHAFTVSITEPLTDPLRLRAAFSATGFWAPDAGAVAIIDLDANRLVGTSQFYRAAACIHGFELGYILHDRADRGKGHAAQAVRMLSDYLFETRADLFRQQLLIETWNTPSWRLAERIGFTREGLLRSSGLGAGDPGDSLVYARTRKDWREELDTKVGR